MRRLAVGIAIASLTLVSACGSDDPDTDTDSGTVTEPTTDTSEDSDAPSEEPDDDSSEEPSEDSSDDGGGASTALTGMVGTEEDPDAFVITLTDESGAEVTTLPAGDYTITVVDPSAIHNFHLTGGDVDESTSVDEITDVTWDVTLEPGDYTFKCDPHPPMLGEFTVT